MLKTKYARTPIGLIVGESDPAPALLLWKPDLFPTAKRILVHTNQLVMNGALEQEQE